MIRRTRLTIHNWPFEFLAQLLVPPPMLSFLLAEVIHHPEGGLQRHKNSVSQEQCCQQKRSSAQDPEVPFFLCCTVQGLLEKSFENWQPTQEQLRSTHIHALRISADSSSLIEVMMCIFGPFHPCDVPPNTQAQANRRVSHKGPRSNRKARPGSHTHRISARL